MRAGEYGREGKGREARNANANAACHPVLFAAIDLGARMA